MVDLELKELQYKRLRRSQGKEYRANLLGRYRELAQSVGCALCGTTAKLMYHHENDNKSFALLQTSMSQYSLEEVIEEIRKCIVLCGRCHQHGIHVSFENHQRVHKLWDEGRFWDQYEYIFSEWRALEVAYSDKEMEILQEKASLLAHIHWPFFEAKRSCTYLEKEDLAQQAMLKYLESCAGKCPNNVHLEAYVYNKVNSMIRHMLQKEVRREEILSESSHKIYGF